MSPLPIGTAPNPFDPAATATAIYKSIADAQAAIPEGHTHAILIDGSAGQLDDPMVYASFIQKAPDGWNLVLDGGYDSPHGAFGGVMVAKSW